MVISMKSYNQVQHFVDSVTVIIQTILMAFVPALFKNFLIQLGAYGIIAGLFIVYVLLLRSKIVNQIALRMCTDTDRNNQLFAYDRFHTEVLPLICELKGSIGSRDDFEKYYFYYRWKKASKIIITFFWDGNVIINCDEGNQVRYLVHSKELKLALTALLGCLKGCADGEDNDTEVQETISILKKMEDQCQ